jgi:23S rRNA pseudouridine1911/1915/1917 synthase
MAEPTGEGIHAASPVRRLRADRGDAGERLDRALVRRLADLRISRSRVRAWIEAGRVRRNGAAAVRPGERLTRGDVVEVDLPPAPPPRPRPPASEHPLTVLFEDEYLLAIDKPPGMLVHPTPGHREGTLVNALLADPHRFEDGRPRLVQRLDQGTSGVLLVARTRAAHAALARALGSPEAEKIYLAVVYGVPAGSKGRIDLRLARNPEDPRRRLASRDRGQPAATRWELLAAAPGGPAGGVRPALLTCRLETGRTHQIRAHLGAVGHPLVGDPLYGEPRHRGIADPARAAACAGFPRQALHAWRLRLLHPFTGRRLELEAPPPQDVAALLRACGLKVPARLRLHPPPAA